MMVVERAAEDGSKRVVGLITSRDLLRIMAAGLKDSDGYGVVVSDEDVMKRVICDYMTPISQVIYGRPDETVGTCRTLMAKVGIKCLPILSKEGRVEGLITAKDINAFGLSASDKGGKKFGMDISERVGLSSDTSMAEPPTYMHTHLALEQSPLYVNIGVAELPHPWKTEESVGFSQRGKGEQFVELPVVCSRFVPVECERLYIDYRKRRFDLPLIPCVNVCTLPTHICGDRSWTPGSDHGS
jgi:CBS domain-containing protein